LILGLDELPSGPEEIEIKVLALLLDQSQSRLVHVPGKSGQLFGLMADDLLPQI
jgi:hypothetical protein